MCGREAEETSTTPSAITTLRKLLAQPGVSPAVEDRDGRPPLLWAASAGSTDAVLSLMQVPSWPTGRSLTVSSPRPELTPRPQTVTVFRRCTAPRVGATPAPSRPSSCSVAPRSTCKTSTAARRSSTRWPWGTPRRPGCYCRWGRTQLSGTGRAGLRPTVGPRRDSWRRYRYL